MSAPPQQGCMPPVAASADAANSSKLEALQVSSARVDVAVGWQMLTLLMVQLCWKTIAEQRRLLTASKSNAYRTTYSFVVTSQRSCRPLSLLNGSLQTLRWFYFAFVPVAMLSRTPLLSQEDTWRCPLCLDLLYKPAVNSCGAYRPGWRCMAPCLLLMLNTVTLLPEPRVIRFVTRTTHPGNCSLCQPVLQCCVVALLRPSSRLYGPVITSLLQSRMQKPPSLSNKCWQPEKGIFSLPSISRSAGHVFCFWCLHHAMDPFALSKCPICRA